MCWCKTNLFASAEHERGLYFSWGNTEGHAFGEGFDFSAENYAASPGSLLTTNITNENDAAYKALGRRYRMPTREDVDELFANCDVTNTTIEEMPCDVFTSRVNGNQLVIPLARGYDGTSYIAGGVVGWYWTRMISSEESAWTVQIRTAGTENLLSRPRAHGMTIRAVWAP